jgi:hypothetical protein
MSTFHPRQPLVDRTGREITEWFQKPAPEPPKPKVKLERSAGPGKITPELTQKWIEQGRPLGGLGNTRFKGGMTKQEMQVRLDEASKAAEEAAKNPKFLAPELQARTGLEMNPLWMLEVLVRSGSLNQGQMVNALKTLAEYTYSKAPNLNQSVNVTMKAEDFLLQLAEEDFPTVDVQRVTRAPNGQGKNNAVEKAKRERYKQLGWLDEKGGYIPKRIRDARAAAGQATSSQEAPEG